MERSRGRQVVRWESTEQFFAEFAGDDDVRGRMSAINLSLLRGARPRWSDQMACVPVMGICMGFKSAGAAFSEWVRVEPRPDSVSGPTVAVTLQSSALVRPPMPGWDPVVGATICRVSTASTVLESFLLQIGDEQLADSARSFWSSTRS